jgi:hypothetical protein
MKLIKLMVKTHLDTGLNYLCKTTKDDPYKYPGSGKHWKKHLKIHGRNIWTNVVFQSYDQEEVTRVALFLSRHWDVVKSRDWANEIDEDGRTGGPLGNTHGLGKLHTEEWKDMMRRKQSVDHIRKRAESKSREWLITHPDGHQEMVRNLNEFCKNNGLHHSAMIEISQGKRKQHKGYIVRRTDARSVYKQTA